MPTYEYQCPNGHRFEKFYPRMNDRRTLKCPTCGKMAQRVISGGAGLVFKGSGFYITDYKRSGEPKDQKETKKEAQAKSPESKTPEAPKKKDAGDK